MNNLLHLSMLSPEMAQDLLLMTVASISEIPLRWLQLPGGLEFSFFCTNLTSAFLFLAFMADLILKQREEAMQSIFFPIPRLLEDVFFIAQVDNSHRLAG